MGYDSEIKARLGVDTSSVAGDLAGATNTFNAWGKKIATQGETHGSEFGGKFTDALEHRLLGTRHLATAVATALGLNVEKIAESIAGAIVGGTAEGWKQAGDLADQNAKLLDERIAGSLNSDQLIAHYERAVEEAVQKQKDIETKGGKYSLTGGKRGYGLNAEELHSLLLAEREQLEAEGKLKEAQDAKNRKMQEAADREKAILLEGQSAAAKYANLLSDIAEAQKEVTATEKDSVKNAEAKNKLLALQKDAAGALLEIQKEDAEAAKKSAEAKEQAARQEVERRNRLEAIDREMYENQKRIEADKNKIDDKSKLTIAEIANLHGAPDAFAQSQADTQDDFKSTFEDDQGLTQAQIDARDKARQVQRLEKKAEAARLSGDQAGATGINSQIDDLRQQLVSSGFAKSTESPDTALLKDLVEAQKVSNELQAKQLDTLKGKFVSQ